MALGNASFEELFNISVLDVIVPVATSGLPSPSPEEPYIDDVWLETLAEDETDRKLAFFDENLDFLLTLRIEVSSVHTDESPKAPPVKLLAFLSHLQITYDASYIASLPSDAPSLPVRTTSIKKAQENTQNKAMSLAPPSHPSIFPPHTPNPVPSSAVSDRQYAQVQGTPLRTGVWGDGMDGDGANEKFVILWSAEESCWIVVFKMTVQVSFMTTKVPDPLLCLTVSTTLREKPLAVTAARKPLQALIDAAGGLPTPALVSSPTRLNGEDDEYERIDVTGLEEVNLLDGLAIGSTYGASSSPLNLPSTRLGPSTRKEVFALQDLTAEPTTPVSTSSTSTVATVGRSHMGSHATLRKSFRKTLRTVSGFQVRMRTVFVPYFMLPNVVSKDRKARNGARRKSLRSPNGYAQYSDSSDSDSDAEFVHERELRQAGNEENTVILCVEVENAQGSSSSAETPFGFSVESVKVSVSGEGAQTRLIAWGETGLTEPERVFPLFLEPNEQYNVLYAVSFLRGPETDDQFSLARGRGLTGPGAVSNSDLQRAVTIVINGRPYEVSPPPDISENHDDSQGKKDLSYPTPTFPSRWNCVLDLSSNIVSANLLANGGPQADPEGTGKALVPNKKEAMPTPASPFPSSVPSSGPGPRPRTSVIFGAGGTSNGGRSISPYLPAQRPGTATPTMVAGSKRHTLGAMDVDMYGGDAGRTKPPRSPVNYRSGTAMLNPANLQDTHLQTGYQQNVINAQAAAAQAQLQNPILGPNSASTKASYLPPSMVVSTYAKSPTTYGPLSPPLPPTPGGRSYAGHLSHFQSHRPAEDSISSFISTDSSSTFTMAVPPTPAYPAYPQSPPPIPTSPTARQQRFWQAPVAGGLQVGASVGPSVEIRREKAGAVGIPQTPAPRVGPGVGVGYGGEGGFAQMQNDVMAGGVTQGGEGEPIVVSVGLLPLSRRKGGANDQREDGKIYPLDQFTLDIFVFNQSSWTRRFEVSHPDRRRKRREQANLNFALGIPGEGGEDESVGVVPLENRVRIGPLLPSTCQSVRMDFLALSPGVHAIDTLTLTDIQSGYTMDLRSVIDIVVHSHDIPSATLS
ncbi:hypothetical protein EIP91_000273 [Steccherinum ochraceum]|uniref:Trafficking protein particle complex II-specific subunit 65 IgD3 domain-containing protein n=1 Tax=Steccherinum ochraceum TaxID=92696 RepID=A0A4R0RK75_9APHY|nr:hypothetical protein EIP91_000273 [Steccherinum ochraceum]